MTQPHQEQVFPNVNSPLTEESRLVTVPWYRFFLSLWKKSGGVFSSVTDATYIEQSGNTAFLHDSASGDVIGTTVLDTTVGASPVPIALGSSPQIFVAPSPGWYSIIGADTVEVSRDSGATWYQIGTVEVQVPVVHNDWVRATWTTLPTVIWFADY